MTASPKHQNSALKPPTAPQRGKKKRPRIKDVENDNIDADMNLDNSQSEQKRQDDAVGAAVTDMDMGIDVPEDEKDAYKELFEAMARFDERGTVYVEQEESPGDADGSGNTNGANVQPDNAKTTGDSKAMSKSKQEKTEDDKPKKKSRRQKKEETRGHIARLKSLAISPEVVDSWDVTASDPLLLVNLKAWPNSVRVPDIWRQKRKYLQNKRGMEKRPFILPSYITDLGIGELRNSQLENDSKKTLKQKQREKMRAKTGKGIEIDPLVLKDAFFKFQTKPKLTPLGDLYYELRELEVDASRFKPGKISAGLRAALGIREDDPPPWLVSMQKFGPPPGYPDIVIPGLNAPIPRGAMFGYQYGGWGKPPVDINGRPIYGDVFGEGLQYRKFDPRFDMESRHKNTLWGEMKSSEEALGAVRKEVVNEAEEETREKDDAKQVALPIAAKPVEEVAPPPAAAMQVPLPIEAIEPPAGGIELRKGVEPGQLYSVLEERKRNVGQNEMHGSKHSYVIDGRDTITDGRVTENPNTNSLTNARKKRKDGAKDGSSSKKQKTFKF